MSEGTKIMETAHRQTADYVGEWRTADGELYNPTPYVQWQPDDTGVTLEGEFTAAELRAIADFMERKGLYASVQPPAREEG